MVPLIVSVHLFLLLHVASVRYELFLMNLIYVIGTRLGPLCALLVLSCLITQNALFCVRLQAAFPKICFLLLHKYGQK